MSKEFILTLASLSLGGGAMIALIVLLRVTLLAGLPRRITAFLWLAAVLRLLIPFSLEVGIPIETEPAARPEQTAITSENAALYSALSIESGDGARLAPSRLAVCVWAVGAGCTAVIFIRAERRLRGRLAQTRKPCEPELRVLFESLRRELVPGRRVELYRSGAVDVPMVIGCFHTAIYLPERLHEPDAERLSLILSHELVHIRRGDLAFKRLLCAAAVLHWFNPLVWLMSALASRDLELACDESVLSRRPELRKSYALCLLESEELRCDHAAAFGGSAISERIEAIMKNTKKITVMGVAGLCAVSVTLMMMFVRATPEYVPASDGIGETSATLEGNGTVNDGIAAADENEKPLPLTTDEPSPEPADEPASGADIEILSPLACEYEVTLGFGTHENPIKTVFHDGIDLACAEGSEIYAVKDGTVLETVYDYERGTYVKLDHGDGLVSIYQHCEKYLVKEGDRVAAGDLIALVGRTGAATGPHLHFGMMLGDDLIDVNGFFEP